MFRTQPEFDKVYDLLLKNYKIFKDAYKYYSSFYPQYNTCWGISY